MSQHAGRGGVVRVILLALGLVAVATAQPGPSAISGLWPTLLPTTLGVARASPDDPPDDPGAGPARVAGPVVGPPTLLCNDNNPCTTDAAVDGRCVYTPVCPPDGNPCTDDFCQDGACIVVSIGIVECDDGNPCTTDVVEDCECKHHWNCDEPGDPCMEQACVNGRCLYQKMDCDDGNPCTDDSCNNGECVNEWICDPPTDPCQERACVNGQCQYQPKDCDDGNICTQDSCDPATGECIHEWPCDPPENPCDERVCINGQCFVQPKNCDDGNPCTRDICRGGECVHIDLCDDFNDCTEDFCYRGRCAYRWLCEEDDGNPCTTVKCINGDCVQEWSCPPPTNPCLERKCIDGNCVYVSKCDDENPCTTDSCDPQTGACTNEWSCPESPDLCQERVCVDGECEYQAKNCDDGDACTQDGCDPATGDCVHESNDCDDDNKCTDDYCDPATGGCVNEPKDCDDDDPCTDDGCDPATGDCDYDPKDCDDDNACTNDSCDPQTGACVHEPRDCDDGDECTEDSCDPVARGCVHTQKELKAKYIQRVTFSAGGMTALTKNGTDTYENDLYGGTFSVAISGAVWVDDNGDGTPNKNEPICHKREGKPRIVIKVVHENPSCPERQATFRGECSAWNIRWEATDTLNGDYDLITFAAPVQGQLPADVQCSTMNLAWSVSYDGGTSWEGLGSTSHRIFITYDSFSERPAKHMEWATTKAHGGANPLAMARLLHRAVTADGHFNLKKNHKANPWQVLDPGPDDAADCETFSYLLKSAIDDRVGLPDSAAIWYVYGSTDSDCASQSDSAWESRTCGSHGSEWLFLWPGPNMWEGCCVYQGVWFPGALDWDKTTGLQVLCEWCASGFEQWWTWGSNNNWHQCGRESPPCP